MPDSRTLRLQSLLWAAFAAACLWLALELAPILSPFLLAAILAYIGNPLVGWLTRHRLPRGAAALLVLLGLVLLVVLLGLTLVPMAEDAARRDFTVNALYYDPTEETIHDYHHGVADLQQKTLRMIGDPKVRYREDPVRMLRAVRLGAKLGLSIDPAARNPIREMGALLENVPAARLFDEMLKLFTSGHALACLRQLREEGLHRGLLPLLDVVLEQPEGKRFIALALENTDRRVREGKPISPGFLFATLLWNEVLAHWEKRKTEGERPIPALFEAMGASGKSAEDFSSHTTCRLGKWYYQGEGRDCFSQLDGYAAMEGPHQQVHQTGKAALEKLKTGDFVGGVTLLEEMETSSHGVLDCLERMAQAGAASPDILCMGGGALWQTAGTVGCRPNGSGSQA